MKRIASVINGQEVVYYRTNPSRKPIVFIHGNSLSSKTFFKQLKDPYLSERYDLIALDLPGYGESANANNPEITYSQLFKSFLTQFYKAIGIQEAIFVGHSLGGNILLENFEDLPNPQALVLIASPPLTNPIDQSVFNPHPAAGLFFKEDLTESDIDVIVSSLVYPGEDMAAELKDELRRADPLSRKYIYQAIATGNMKNEVAVAEKAIIPIALIQGTSDQLINSDYYARLNIPKLWKGQVQYIEKAGHTPQLEQPQAINNLLYNLIKDIRY